MKVKRMKYVNKYNLPIDSIYYDTTELSEYKFEQHIFCDDVQNEEFATLFWILLYFYSNQTLFPFTYFDGSNLRIIEIESDKIDIYSLSCKLQEEIAYGNNVYCDGNDIPIVFTFDTTAYTELKKSNTIMVINIDFKSREKIKIYYNKYLFFRETIERFEDNLIYIWMQQRYNKNIFIEEIDPVCKAEKRLLRSFNNKIFNWNTEETFLETFLRHLERFADNRAYVEGEYVLTYRRLNQMANYWAKQLLGASNDYIGIYMKSDIATVVAILAILKAGKIIVTINPSYPVQRIRDIIAQLNITTLLTCNQTFLCAVEEKFVCDTFIIDMNNMPVDDYGEEINCIRKPDDICYVVYTSGTTGVPKGVMISHRNIMIELKFAKHFFGYNQSTHSLHMLNYSFDFGLFDFLINLYSGSCLYSLDKTRMKSFKDYIQFIGDNYIENINTTPTFFSIIASFKKRLSSLKVVHLGGEKVTYEMINKYYEILDDECTVYNGYGPCEVTIGSAIHPVTLREREKSNQVVENVPIGPPTDDSYMYVLNKNHKMVPINALGELYVGGKGVGLGYVNKSENDGKFIYIPDVHSGILYKTGDIVKWLSNGQVEFYGRKDSQVKINGFRIELSEIDNLLMHHINIEQAKTICVNRRMNNKLICFLRINSMLSEDEIRDYLTEKLPTYMIPGQFRFINEFPISTSGKIDEKRLENLI